MRSISVAVCGALLLANPLLGRDADAQERRIRPSISLAMQSQDAGGVPRGGAALGVGAWIVDTGRLHGRIEAGFGASRWLVAAYSVPPLYPVRRGGLCSFPELLTLSGGTVIGRIVTRPWCANLHGRRAFGALPKRFRSTALRAAASIRRAITARSLSGWVLATGRAFFRESPCGQDRALREWDFAANDSARSGALSVGLRRRP